MSWYLISDMNSLALTTRADYAIAYEMAIGQYLVQACRTQLDRL